MAITYKLTNDWAKGNDSLASSKEISGDAVAELSVVVPATTTDKQVNITIDVSTMQVLYVRSSQALTVETNSSSAPDDTLTLVADLAEEWNTHSNQTNPLGTDVTALYLTNAGNTEANFELRVLLDSTP